MRSSSSTLLACLCLSGLVSCSASDAASTGGGGSGGGPATCIAPGYKEVPEPEAITIDLLTATLVDPSGNLVPNSPVQLCGTNVCANDDSNALGKVSAPDTKFTPFVKPAFKFGDGYDFAELAILLGRGEKQDLGTVVAWPLPSYAEGAPFPKQGPVSNGDFTLFVDEGRQVDHEELNYRDESEQVLRSVRIDLAQSALALPDSFGFELAYGLSPLGTKFCPPARFSVKNSEGWAPGTEVLAFIQGLEAVEEWAPYGTWHPVAEAVVSSDGASIESTSGGIPILSSIALRRK